MEFINLKAQYQYLKTDIDAQIQAVLDGGHFILGENVRRFEEKLAAYVGATYAIGCSDGTAALQMAYMAYGIGPGDVVFCPDMTFIASVEPACLLGATPVFCDIDADSYNLSPASLERQIKAVLNEGKLRPRAIIAVDFVGNPADYRQIQALADKYGLLLVEDAAQGMGASYQGRKCGSFGDIATTSFFPAKPLGCYGDGGAVFTDDTAIAEILRSLRVHGKGIDKYNSVRIGLNARLDELQAAILLVKLAALDEEMEKRRALAVKYDRALQDRYKVPHIDAGNLSSYAQYIIMAREAGRRDELQCTLKEKGIPTILYYPTPMHLVPVFRNAAHYAEGFENTIHYANEAFGIPFSPYLTEEESDEVIRALKS